MTTRLIRVPTSLLLALITAPADGESQSKQTPLRLLAELPLPGSAKGLDYQSLNPSDGRLYIAQWEPAGSWLSTPKPIG